MSFNFEPNYTVLTFLFVKKFIFIELLAVLALLRLILGPRLSRLTALLALILCLAAIATTFAPALGVTGVPYYTRAAQTMLWANGMVAMLAPAMLLLFGAMARPRPAAWLEILTFVATMGLVGLWIATMF